MLQQIDITRDPILTQVPGKYNHPPLKTTAQLLARYGNPVANQKLFEKNWMVLIVVPQDIHTEIPCLPLHLYLNKDIVMPLLKTYRDLISADLHHEIKTWDGCFNVRAQRGSTVISRHSFGIAVDENAAWNKLYGQVSWTEDFLNVWRNSGWICGADFHSRTDGMHMEWTAADSW